MQCVDVHMDVYTVQGKSFKVENFCGFHGWLGNRECFPTLISHNCEEHMTLFKYLKPKKKPPEELLPDPEGSLSKHLSSDAIREANKEVKLVLSKESSKRSPYLKATGKQKAIIGKYAAENGIVKSIQHFQKNFPDNILKENTVCGWKIPTFVSYRNESILVTMM